VMTTVVDADAACTACGRVCDTVVCTRRGNAFTPRMTERLYSTDAYAREIGARVTDVDRDAHRVLLDRTVFYPGGGGQPFDEGELRIGDDRLRVSGAAADSRGVWHTIEGGLPPAGTDVIVAVNWVRRLRIMRTHTAVHALCGVLWERYQSPVTGSDMGVGTGRLDIELPHWNHDDLPVLDDELNRRLVQRLPVQVSFLPREDADEDPSLIRTKVSLLPPSLRTVRVVDIVGLDRQADGGTHVRNTSEVGAVRLVKAESKGKMFRRLRLALEDGDSASPA
jgi:misacylated tRNA(Ala) deacylase